MMISNVKGNFSGLTGMLNENTHDPARIHVEATIAVCTISSVMRASRAGTSSTKNSAGEDVQISLDVQFIKGREAIANVSPNGREHRMPLSACCSLSPPSGWSANRN
jgi:hypothetical protein